MKDNKNTIRQAGALLLEALMIVFVVVHSWTGVKARDNVRPGDLTLSVTPAEQLVFRDSHSSTESLLEVAAKLQFIETETIVAIDVPSLELSTSDALLITAAFYNTFYTNTTIHAP